MTLSFDNFIMKMKSLDTLPMNQAVYKFSHYEIDCNGNETDENDANDNHISN